MTELNVKVSRWGDRTNLAMYYDCPQTGKRVMRSTGTHRMKDAQKAAGKWEDELRAGRYKPASRITWAEFRERYEDEVLTSLARKTDEMVGTVFNAVERICNPQRLSQLTAERLSYFQSQLRTEGRAEATIRSYLAHLKSSLNWAVDVGLMGACPKVKMPQRAKGAKLMKGRPITTEEFERMLAACEKVRPNDFLDWQWHLRGLWLSGLRLAESLSVSWDIDAPFAVDMEARRPRFRIDATAQKAARDELLPMTPDFAEFLAAVPPSQRTGPVFPIRLSEKRLSRIISAIGQKAGVKVDTFTKTAPATGLETITVKYASAHDLRRAFGTRWASKVAPATLQRLMRHSAIETTMHYYVALDTDDIADQLWAGHDRVNTFVNTSKVEGHTDEVSAEESR